MALPIQPIELSRLSAFARTLVRVCSHTVRLCSQRDSDCFALFLPGRFGSPRKLCRVENGQGHGCPGEGEDFAVAVDFRFQAGEVDNGQLNQSLRLATELFRAQLHLVCDLGL